ncbi:thioredoxin family protein [Bacillus sp. EB600]|nr:thioredoxin family protein [Bacillus sp. EB600]
MREWNHDELLAFLTAKATGIVYIYTPLCGTCQVASKMMRVVAEMSDLDMGMMNLNFYPELAVNMAVESVPCLLLIKEGIVVDKIYAFHSVPFLLEKINELKLTVDIDPASTI